MSANKLGWKVNGSYVQFKEMGFFVVVVVVVCLFGFFFIVLILEPNPVTVY